MNGDRYRNPLFENTPPGLHRIHNHATVLAVHCGNTALYSRIKEFNPIQITSEFNVVAKQSLEKLSASEADVFTTVSEITSRECSFFLGKDPDIITPNGFEDSFVPAREKFGEKRAAARKKLREVAEAVLGYQLHENCIFIANSGRYESGTKASIFLSTHWVNLIRMTSLKRNV
jgi:phosphorylase/glycogen(starch) synthase